MPSVNDNLALLILMDALKRAADGLAVIPYYGMQGRTEKPRQRPDYKRWLIDSTAGAGG